MLRLKPKRDCKGFTLFEVLVAVAILGIGLTIVIELFSGGLRLGRISGEYTKAMNYAKKKIEEIAIKPEIEEGIEEGRLDEDFRWQIIVKKEELLPIENRPDFKPPVDFFKIQVNIFWKSGIRERSIHLESCKVIKLEEDEKG